MATKTTPELQAMIKKRFILIVVFLSSLIYIGWVCSPDHPIPPDSTAIDRMLFTLRWLALSIVPIVIGFLLVALVRYDHMDTAGVVTTTPYAEELVRLKQRAFQNNLEQTAMHVPTMLILSTYLDASTIKLVPILICIFVFGRIIYYIGYLATGDHLNRGYGFFITLLVNFVPLAYCLYRLFTGGASFGLPLAN